MGKNQSASNLTNIIKQDANGNISFVSGSTTLMSVSSSGAITTTGNVAGTASYASNAELLDGLDSTVFTLTSSFAAQTASFTAFTSSVNSFTSSLNSFSASVLTFTASQNILNGTYATTGSNTFTGIQTINSNLIVTGSITAQTLVVQTITSSVDFVTGSTRFGSSLSTSTHQFTGSVSVTGSSTFSGSIATTGNITLNKTSPNIFMRGGYAQDLGFFLNNEPAVYLVDDATATKGIKVNISTGALTQLGSGSVSFTGAATFSSSVTASASSLFNANNGALSADILTIRGGGGSGAFGFKVEANNGEDIFYTDHFTYNIIANPLGGKFGIGTISPSQILTIQYPYAKTDTTQRYIADFRSNDASNPFALTMGAIGAASLASRAFTMQTADNNLANGGNIVLQPYGGNVLIGTTTSNSFNFVAGASAHSFLGNTMQISSDDYGGTERQTSVGAATWGGDSNPVINLASIFPRLTFTSRALSILCQIITSTTSTTSCAALVLFCRTINGTWSNTVIANININGLALSSASGSGTSVTLNFGTPNYGNATFTIMNRS